jgi:hypothetical protein
MDLETNILPPNPDKPGTNGIYLANLLPKGLVIVGKMPKI